MLSIAVALLCYGATARAQDTAVSGRCATPDTIVFRGAERTGDATVRSESGLVPSPVNYRALERAIKAVYATGQFDDVIASCELGDGRAALTFTLKERPVLGSFDVTGTDRLSRGSVRDKIELTPGKPLDPAQVAHAVKRVDSLYVSQRSDNWLKFKSRARQEFVVGGFYDREGSRREVGALLLGYYDGGALRCIIKPFNFARYYETLQTYQRFIGKRSALDEVEQQDVDRLYATIGIAREQSLPKNLNRPTLEWSYASCTIDRRR